MQYIVKHTAVGIQGRTLNQGEVIEGSELGDMVDRLVEVGAIDPVGSHDVEVKADGVSEVTSALQAEIETLKAKNAEAMAIIDVMTDEELAELKGRAAANKPAPVTREGLSELTKVQLGEMCDSLGIKYEQRANKDAIIDLILAH